MFKTFVIATLVAAAAASCPNSCSGHGICGANDVCSCWLNFEGPDCSQRVCKEGKAWEQGHISDSHAYATCSNRGSCDTATGECQCFPGFTGAACDRSTCPNDCSGHGTCEVIEDLSGTNTTNWEVSKITGCRCDGGWNGADCSNRLCAYGDDPLTVCGNVANLQTWDITATQFDITDEVVVIIRGLDNTTEVSRPIPWLTAGTANAEAIIEQMQIAGDVTVTTWGLTTGTTIAFVDPIRVSAVWVEAKLCTAAGCYPKSATSAGTANKITSVKMSQDADATKETAQCSNRGICDGATGVCGCFAGFTGEACSLQTILV